MTVNPIHAEAIGTFAALVARSGATADGKNPVNGTLGIGARLDVTTTYTGDWSGKLLVGPTTYPIKGKLNNGGSVPRGTVEVLRKAPLSTLTVTFDLAVNGSRTVSGTVTDTSPTTAAISGWALIWNTAKVGGTPATTRAGTHNFMASIPVGLEGDVAHPTIPQGDSYASASVTLAGVVTVAGKAADGSTIGTSGPMGPNGEFLVYQSLYTPGSPGSFIGTLTISAATHAVSGALTWSRAEQPSGTLLYQLGWPAAPITLDIAGGLFVAPVAPAIIMGARIPPALTDYNDTINATITFFDDATGIPTSASAVNPNLNGSNKGATTMQGIKITSAGTFINSTTRANPGAVTLSFTKVSGKLNGLFSGSFVLNDAGVLRTVKYYGIVIPDSATPATEDAIGAGYYVLTGQPATAASKSGRVTLLPIP
jgi:hypothetical protein